MFMIIVMYTIKIKNNGYSFRAKIVMVAAIINTRWSLGSLNL